MDKYEIIGKDVWGVKAKNLTNVTNCSVCRYKGYTCSAVDCCEFFYLKDEEIEKLENKNSYKVIEKNQYGTRVRNNTEQNDCFMCKYSYKARECKIAECAPNSFYLPDSEVERLELENDLKEKNEAFETRINELEDTIENENETEIDLFVNDGIEVYECLSCGMLFEENEPYNNFCPNCGRKIIKK